MLSGVGPADHLTSLGIPVVVDLPGVGTGLKDHPVVDLNYMDKYKQSLSFLRPSGPASGALFVKAVLQWLVTGKGPLTTNVRNFARTCHVMVYIDARDFTAHRGHRVSALGR